MDMFGRRAPADRWAVIDALRNRIGPLLSSEGFDAFLNVRHKGLGARPIDLVDFPDGVAALEEFIDGVREEWEPYPVR